MAGVSDGMHQRDSVVRILFAGAGLALVLLTVLHGTGALAQSASGPQMVAGAPASEDGATLSAFVEAAHAVSALRDSYMPRITAANIAERPQRAAALFDEMRARMHDAIEAAGLSVERYQSISQRAAQDARLRARIEAVLSGNAPQAVPSSPSDKGVRADAGTQPPAPSNLMSRAQNAVDLSLAEQRIAQLERKLANAETRVNTAEAERRRAASEAARLRADHAALVADFNAELNARPSSDAVAATERQLASARAERTALREGLAGLLQGLTMAVAALEDLDASLDADASDHAGASAVRRFTRLEPVAMSGRLPGFSANQGALQAQLDAAEARNLALHATRRAERANLRREIARISAEIAAARRELAALEDRVAGPLLPPQIEAVADAAAGAAEPPVPAAAPEPPAAPANAAAGPSGAIGDGIRAYEAKDFSRAHAIWLPLAKAGDPLAQFHIGALYFEGRGVPRDLPAARDWLARALGQGVERARFLLGRVEKGLARAG